MYSVITHSDADSECVCQKREEGRVRVGRGGWGGEGV